MKLKSLPALILISLLSAVYLNAEPNQPNVILIMTDDQGFGDFGVLGNELINTPHLDQLARESASMENFYVSPVCSPTRASLMTGRYNYRTRVVDTFKGRSMMDPQEYTLAEALADNGYATGIFGKWHLGDNYPLRASDQGFQETYVHFGGGLAQPSEPIENQRRYTNPILYHNNQKIQTRGYCTDLYFEAATRFIDKTLEDDKPFFAYVATNAPHGPYHDVPEALYQKYKHMNLKSIMVDQAVSEDTVARIFAMIENIDENVGRLMDHLERREIARETIVIYLNDNGPNSRRFVGSFRGRKNEIQEGGIRSPLWVRWPAHIQPGQSSDRISAHYDIMPTILDAAGAKLPSEVKLDGRSLLPLLEGEKTNWPERDIFIQSHRGDEPIPEHNMMIRSQRWKLVRPSGFHSEELDPGIAFELYDMQKDPGETTNLAFERKDVTADMLARYHTWFDDVSSTRPDNYAPPRMRIGNDQNSQLILTSQDRRIIPEGYEWHIQIDQKGRYKLTAQWASPTDKKTLRFALGGQSLDANITQGTQNYVAENIVLDKGPLNFGMVVPSDFPQKELPYYILLEKQ